MPAITVCEASRTRTRASENCPALATTAGMPDIGSSTVSPTNQARTPGTGIRRIRRWRKFRRRFPRAYRFRYPHSVAAAPVRPRAVRTLHRRSRWWHHVRRSRMGGAEPGCPGGGRERRVPAGALRRRYQQCVRLCHAIEFHRGEPCANCGWARLARIRASRSPVLVAAPGALRALEPARPGYSTGRRFSRARVKRSRRRLAYGRPCIAPRSRSSARGP